MTFPKTADDSPRYLCPVVARYRPRVFHETGAGRVAGPLGRSGDIPGRFHEVGIKSAKKRLRLPMSFAKRSEAVCAKYGLTVLPVTREIAVLAARLPPVHTDPFDCIIIATAPQSKLCVVTADTKFAEYLLPESFSPCKIQVI